MSYIKQRLAISNPFRSDADTTAKIIPILDHYHPEPKSTGTFPLERNSSFCSALILCLSSYIFYALCYLYGTPYEAGNLVAR